ncbi:ubiquitin-conjugating enzyme E2 T-like [Leptopilina heterotoma]|uniref:ubiquitin-conjugating enzyme E2 T-like n=1 Tax=Leptopilina heterotoma TaxID=63436 RepID=UPI001CA9EB2B|nr:ubiquitin-conjugating enzyme E2 T-like [Leptopilina heterotoma]XP_043479551.1 ubiquitin-conjugating enzyme E2 T-like [Leptopilina heterotoma]XP_043479552.1 ubiquitin-conjugating enzyme E2 T-like [Leptopilina heterotoma]
MTAIQRNRIKKELARLSEHPPEGISCYAKNDKLDNLTAVIIGPNGTPYEGGLFQLDVNISERYPFEPPSVKFVTPVYHPNIDTTGLICMDLLKMPPKGGWNPTISLENLLTAVQLLLGNPNPDDPLMAEIADELKYNKAEFERKARMFMLSNSNSKN